MSAIPEGWMLVPIEPTYEMLVAKWNVSASDAHTETGVAECAWAAMLAAAPAAPPYRFFDRLREAVKRIGHERVEKWYRLDCADMVEQAKSDAITAYSTLCEALDTLAAEQERARSAKMDALVNHVHTSDKFSFDGACQRVGEAIQQAEQDRAALVAENENLREMLAHVYAGSALYSDDGELQDGRAYPFIDFKRDSAADIRWAMVERKQEQQR